MSTAVVSESFGLLPYRILEGEANTPQWLKKRQCGVGASEAAAVLGDSAWGTPRTVYEQKVAEDVVDATTDLMEFGHLAEPLIVAFMEAHPERFGYLGEIIPADGLLQSIEWPWLLGTLDRQLRTPSGAIVPLELKSVNDFVASEWRGGDDDYAPFVVPQKYLTQINQQMAVTGAPFGYCAVWLGKGKLEVIRVERDEEFIEKYLIGIVGDFWHYNVEARTPPPPTMNDKLWEIWPGDDTLEPVVADEDLIDAIGIWRVTSDDKRTIDKTLKEQKFYITDRMGDATSVIDPVTKEVIHTLKGQKTARGTDYLMLEAKFADAYEECVKPAGWTRVHRATKVKVG